MMDARDKKDRKNVNVSLRKRDKDLLNTILNAWYDEGYNISNEVCDAIILKNLSNTNPHIQTILSTLSLIESSLKSHFATKGFKDEVISQKALEIFNEVITIDIDGNKLTNLIKGVGIDVNDTAINTMNNKKEDRYVQIEDEQSIETKKPQEKSDKELVLTTDNSIKNIAISNSKNVENTIAPKEDVRVVEKVEYVRETEEVEEDIFGAYTMPSGFTN